jgi:hypothetical protein
MRPLTALLARLMGSRGVGTELAAELGEAPRLPRPVPTRGTPQLRRPDPTPTTEQPRFSDSTRGTPTYRTPHGTPSTRRIHNPPHFGR